MSNSLQELHKIMEQGDFSTWMLDMDYPIISIMESFQKEKQIMVDPLSLKDSHSPTKHLMLPTVITNSGTAATLFHPPPLQPPTERFLSLSLPNSANSSPRFGSALSKKKSKSGSPEPKCEASKFDNKLQDLLHEVHLGKSKSCGEARSLTPFEEFVSFDHWLSKTSAVEQVKLHHDGKISKTEAVKESPKSNKSIKHMKTPENDGLKCSALCLYLPGFGGSKVKPVKTRKEGSKREAVMSRTVSLENFECGSWASAAMFHEIEGDSVNNYYFDLPIELMKHNSASEECSPVKGVLKNSSSRGSARKSDTSSPRHHVRFTTSSSSGSYPASPASCITPRLRKARDDFNSFLAAAQSA
ncbi:uncharacterized protein LOC130723473 [Lotus japonicus]|uniref:uncharacterized protein LOC130723473 n=1 Tax=Lotus japonicus TaxID=34305 RepID=UPI0025901DBA|nr:uncharacterized protein LOC130723473 [Lotus japonicus]